jgi:hypothetical protein
MTNACSVERVFWCKVRPRHRRITTRIAPAIACLLVVLLASGCLADAQHVQTIDLLDRLTHARGQLAGFPPPKDACNEIGDVETRLYGEPGLTEVVPAWSELADAAHALQAVCGQDILLLQPVSGSSALETARARWSAGQQRELGVACDHLRAAASALRRDAPC